MLLNVKVGGCSAGDSYLLVCCRTAVYLPPSTALQMCGLVLYRSETWILLQEDMNRLQAVEVLIWIANRNPIVDCNEETPLGAGT